MTELQWCLLFASPHDGCVGSGGTGRGRRYLGWLATDAIQKTGAGSYVAQPHQFSLSGWVGIGVSVSSFYTSLLLKQRFALPLSANNRIQLLKNRSSVRVGRCWVEDGVGTGDRLLQCIRLEASGILTDREGRAASASGSRIQRQRAPITSFPVQAYL